jgi:hypothetical protein
VTLGFTYWSTWFAGFEVASGVWIVICVLVFKPRSMNLRRWETWLHYERKGEVSGTDMVASRHFLRRTAERRRRGFEWLNDELQRVRQDRSGRFVSEVRRRSA